MEYLRKVRLDHVHSDLADCDPATTTVSDIAHRWGFHHMDAFRCQYIRAFGAEPALRG